MPVYHYHRNSMSWKIIKVLKSGSKNLDEIQALILTVKPSKEQVKTDLRTMMRGRLSALKKKGIVTKENDDWKLVAEAKI